MRGLFRTIAARFRRPSRLRYKLLAIFGDLISFDRREEVLDAALSFVAHSKVEGDYLEFGVWKGGSLSAACHLSRRFKQLASMRFFGFDSFEGLPDIAEADAATGEFAKGDYATSKEVVEQALVKSGVDMNRVTLVKGWYDESLTPAKRSELALTKAAVVYIDCDLYESTVPVLEFITPLLSDGTIIIFDDWFCFRGHPDRGEQRAFREWTTEHKIRTSPYKQFGWTGLAHIVHQGA
jgi:hypothetical protein